MEEFIKEFIEYMVDKFKKDNFDIDVIKYQLISKFNKKSLMYKNIAKNWLNDFFKVIKSLGFGYYNMGDQRLYLNRNNDWIEILMVKNEIPERIINPNKGIEVYDELIK